MRRLILPTLAIATGITLAGAPLAPSAAGDLSKDTPHSGKPGTWHTAKMPSAQTERDIYPNTSPTGEGTWPNWLQQRRLEFPDQAETVYPGTPPRDRLGIWSTGAVKTNMTLIERVRQRIEQAFPNADISAMANADKGAVTLMGLVATKKEKKRAHDLVAHTKGVTEVHDELQVNG